MVNRFDAGVRLGEVLAKDMVTTRGEQRPVVIGSPAYFARHPAPATPQNMAARTCLNLRLSSGGGLYAWELEKARPPLRVRGAG